MPDDRLNDLYIDESSQTANRYLVLGGIIVPSDEMGAVEARVQNARLPELPHGEMKWGKVSRSKFPAYKRVVDTFFDDHPLRDSWHFHSLIVDTTQQDHDAYNDGSREVGFNKEVYQLASKFSRLYTGLFHVYLDERETSQSPDDLRLILNRGARVRGDRRDWPFRRCHFRNSKETALLQVVDIFIGAIAYQLNGHINQPGGSPCKAALSRHVCQRAGVGNVFADTSRKGKFTIWHRQLKRRRP